MCPAPWGCIPHRRVLHQLPHEPFFSEIPAKDFPLPGPSRSSMAGSSEIKEEYTSSLADLTFNSKPLISVLTILAEENIAHAKDIVEAIETHLSRVRTEVKLPVLYLIDCIIKNVGGPYTTLFCQNIVSTFCNVFDKVDERTRAEMFRLRQTWNDVLPPKKLYALDVQIAQLDPAWPVTAPPPSSIHFNPKFLKSTSTTVSSNASTTPVVSKPASSLITSTTSTATLDPKTLSMQQKLIDKQRQLLELQQKKLELELLQTQVKLQEQLKNQATVPISSASVSSTSSSITSSQNILLKPEVAKQMAISTNTNKTTSAVSNMKSKIGPQTVSTVMNAKLQNNQTNVLPRIAPVQNNLVNARPIRDPRLLRHQQQQQQPAIVNSNVLDAKSKSGTQVSVVESDNKIVNNKAPVRNDRLEPRLVNNKGIVEPQGKSKTSPHSSPTKHISKSGSPRKASKFRDSKSSSSPSSSDLTDAKGSSSSLGSPSKVRSDSPAKGRPRPLKLKKKIINREEKNKGDKDVGRFEKSGAFRPERDGAASKKIDKHSKVSKSDKDGKLRKSEFKDLKGSTKNRNYIRRNRDASLSPEPNQDVDLRVGAPPDKQPRIQGDIIEDKNLLLDVPNDLPPQMDVDLRQLPAMIGKKRPSTETKDSPSSKKSKSEMFDVLFGSEDIDLRQLPPVISPKDADRPPTPPPPIISEKPEKLGKDKKEDSPMKNPKLQALRAKLANAVNLNKLKDNDPVTGDIENELQKSPELARKLPSFINRSNSQIDKIIISPADEESIKAGNMTKAQETALMKKIIAQIETQKLREAQRKESESLGNISLQPISDDEFDADFSGSESEEEYQKKDDKDRDVDDRHQDDIDDPFKERRDERIHNQEDYPKFRMMEHRDPRRGARPWRVRHRMKGWDGPPGPMMRPGMRPPIRPGHEPWMWRAMGPPMFNNFDQMMPMHVPEQGSQSPTSHDIPALQYAHPDSFKFITIDGEPREIRYYDETAIVFMSAGDPREITFHNGTRRIFFDGEPFTLKLNHPYEEISIKGNIHRVRLGAPSREIFIDGNGYECYFDSNEKTIELDGNKIVVKLEPPPPQVKIGQEKRLDLVAGKTQLVVDAKNMFTVFLDAKPQTFEIDGKSHTLKFVDALRAVQINDDRFEVEFGGLPKPIMLNSKKHFIRFSVLPKGIKPGHLKIKDMEGCQTYESPKQEDENSQDSQSVNPLFTPDQSMPVKKMFEPGSPDRNSNSPHHFQNLAQQSFNNLEILSSVMASSMVPSTCEGGYMVEDTTGADSQPEPPTSNANSIAIPVAPSPVKPTPPVLNINELFQRLVATGIVTTAAQTNLPPQPEEPLSSVQKVARNQEKLKNLKPVDFSKPETLKMRRTPLIQGLYVGMQCSSCGMRFPPEQSMYYTQHLDWHFRQNRRGKKNIRKAAARRWYYGSTDWTNYQEIEDLEEREKNYFENQNQGEAGNEEADDEIEIPCVPADPDIQTAACEMCQDKFEQFYNEEKDEWQLRMAIRVDNKTYHPLCYDDYQASLVDESVDQTNSRGKGAPGSVIPLLEVPPEEPAEEEKTEDDVMEVIDNIDDDDDDVPPEEEKKEKEEAVVEDGDDDDVILNEVAPVKIVVDDDDDKDDYVVTSGSGLIPGVVVKEEPIDDGFIDVGSNLVKMKSDVINIKPEANGGDNDESEPSRKPSEMADTTHIEVVSTMDGNVEMESGAPVQTTSSMGSKIKINITKPLPAVVPRENKEVVTEELTTECLDPNEPLPPGEEPVQLNVKPALKGLDLKRQPVVKKGSELTGLCSIM